MSEKVGATTFTKTSDGLTEIVGDIINITQGPNTLTGDLLVDGDMTVTGEFSFSGPLALRNSIDATMTLEMNEPPNNRGLIRTSTEAFGLDIETQGTGKSIRLSSNIIQATADTINLIADYTEISNLTATDFFAIKDSTGPQVEFNTSNVAASYTLTLPSTEGAAGLVLGNAGGGVLQWVSDGTGPGGTVTSVALSAPSFLSVSGSPVTTTGTLALAYSGTPLPVLYGGTGTTTATGSGSVVLSSNATVSNFSLGNSSATTLQLNSAVYLTAISGTYTFVLPATTGTAGQALVTDGSGVTSWSSLPTVPITSVGLAAPPFLTVTGSPLTSSGTITLSYSGTPLPVLYGGTGTTTSTGTGSVVLSDNPVFNNKITVSEITSSSILKEYTSTPLPAIAGPFNEPIPELANDLSLVTYNVVPGNNPPASIFPPVLGGNLTISTGKWQWDSANTRPSLSLSAEPAGFTTYTPYLTSGSGGICSFTLTDASMFTPFTRFSVTGFSQYVGTYYVFTNNGTTVTAKGTATGTPSSTVFMARSNNYVQAATSITGNGVTLNIVTPGGNNLFENFEGFYISGGGIFEGGYTVIGGDEFHLLASSTITGTETSNIYVGRDDIYTSYSGQVNVLSAQDLTLGSNQSVNVDAIGSIKLKGDESVTIESIGVTSISSTGASAWTSSTGSLALTAPLGSINITTPTASVRAVTISNFAYLPDPTSDAATMRNAATGANVLVTPSDIFIVTEDCLLPTIVPVSPVNGNIFIECKSAYGGIKVYASNSGSVNLAGGAAGTRVGYDGIAGLPRGPVTLRGTETTIESYSGDIYIDSQTSVTVESNTDLTLKTGVLGNVVFDTTSLKAS
jgi:hypothetical protein